MSELRNKFIQQMQLKAYSSRTINTYVNSLSALAKYFNTSPDLLTADQIREYLHFHLTEKKLSKSWMKHKICALKMFYCQVLKRDWKLIDIPYPRGEKKLPVVLSKEEISKIIHCTENMKHRALLMVTYSAGLRLSEVCNLKITDVDSTRMQIRVVQSKGCKDRYTILSAVTLDILRKYWIRFRPQYWLFENNVHEQYSTRSAQQIFTDALRKSGNKKKAGIHSLRHSFATHLMEQGVALPIIQQLMGHNSLKTTSIYLHVQQYTPNTVKSPLDTFSL